jgi:hypothetical protein
MESLSRWREPVTAILAAVVGVRTAVLLVLMAVSLGASGRAPGQQAGVRLAASVYASDLAEPLLIVVVTALVLLCAYTDAPHARRLTILAMVVCGLSVLSSLVLGAVGLALGGGVPYGLLVRLALPLLAVAVLVKLARIQSRPDREDGRLELEAAEAGPAELLPAEAGEDLDEQREQPLWQPDEASGAAWHSAGAAAAGAAASGWGRPGEPGGWDPDPQPQPAPGPSAEQSHPPHLPQETRPDVPGRE